MLRPHGKDLRTGRISIPGQVYLVTSVTLDRRPFFADFWRGRILVNTMRHYAKAGKVESLAYVIMPNHFHWLLALTGECSLSTLMGQVKGAAAHHLNQLHVGAPSVATESGMIAAKAAPTVRLGRIWQKGFHDRALRRDEDIRSVARYMVMNPVRAGVARRIWDYPLWDAVWVG
jgi:REP element-mobilizing transposase RayT